jgi:uncharacterized protein (TIGR03000 family)
MRATFLSFALTSALALAGGGSAMAQHHGGGGHFGGGHVGGVHVAPGHWGYQHYGYGHYGYGAFWGAGLYFGAPYGGYYGSPGYYYSTPAYDGAPYAAAAMAGQAQAVLVTVEVPKADAEVFLNDTPTTLTGIERVFQSPPLDPGVNYKYTVKARWMEDGKMVEQKREVPVQAGQSVTVDFRQPTRETVAPPEIR